MRDTDSEQTRFLPEETCTASGAAHQLNSFPWALWRASAATDLAWVSPTERKPNNQFLASCKRLKDYRIHKNTSAYRKKKKKMQMFCQILMNSKAPSITGNSIWKDYFTTGILFVSPQTWMKGIQLASLHTAMFALFLPHWLSLTSIPS